MTAIAVILLTIIFLSIIYGISAFVLMLAWNAVMPLLFHLILLTFWQALAIVLLLGFVKQIISITIQK